MKTRTVIVNDNVEIRFYLSRYRGRCSANIRKFVKTNKYTGPTKKGIQLNRKELQGIYESLKKLSPGVSVEEEEELDKIPICMGRFISVRTTIFNKECGIDIREHVDNEKYMGPTKRGIRIPFKYLNDVRLYMKEMINEYDEWEE